MKQARESVAGGRRTTVFSKLASLAILTYLAILPGLASAAGMFYVEETQDGRIYVFNDMKAYEEWKSSGEMGKSLTRIGHGPNGETVVFDSEEALHLYNFKHDLPGEVIKKEEKKEPTVKVSWKDGKTTIETDKARLDISNRIQVRWTDTDNIPSDLEGIAERFGSFRIRRAKTKFAGWFYSKDLTYELQLNWAAPVNELEDANINFDFTKGKKNFMIKAGQFKVPFGRQELTSSGSQQFVDRSIASLVFAFGRDIGVQLWGTPMGGKIDWRIGLFNGGGVNLSRNNDDQYEFDARLTFQPWGDVIYSEGDFESQDKPLFAVAVDFQNDNQLNVASISLKSSTFGADAVFKYKGIFAYWEGYWGNAENQANAKFDTRGQTFQAGYFIIPKKLEFAFRYSDVDPNTDIRDNKRKEKGIGGGYYFNKHNLKFQADYIRLENEVTDGKINEVRAQLQFIF